MIFSVDYPSLNFSLQVPLLLRQEEGKTWVFDEVRKKYVVLTPEEWVRQHLILHLIGLGYSPSLMVVEKNIVVNRMKKKVDVLAYNRDMRPFLLVECKAFHTPLNEQAIRQAYRYHYGIGASYVAITNGISHFIVQGNRVILHDFPPLH